jgi:hypothetical protein
MTHRGQADNAQAFFAFKFVMHQGDTFRRPVGFVIGRGSKTAARWTIIGVYWWCILAFARRPVFCWVKTHLCSGRVPRFLYVCLVFF